MKLQPRYVDPIKLPTLFAEFNPDLSTYEKPFIDCSGCENVGAADSVIDFLSKAIKSHPELIWDHWNPQDINLRNKIAKLHNVDVHQVFITSGAIAGIDYCFRIFTKEGTKTGFLKPEWPGFVHYADFHKNEKFFVENLEFPFIIDAKKISAFVQEKELDFMIFANPVPVQGNQIPMNDIESILLENPETLFVIDEADTVTPATQAASLAGKYNNVIFLGSLSKFYGLSGLRIGYLISPKEYVTAFKNTINVIEVSSLAVLAANIVLDDMSYQKQTQQNVELSLRFLQEACEGTSYQISGTPHCFGAYIYSATRNPKTDLESYKIKILEGQYFGLPENVSGGRFNLSNPALAKLAADKIKEIHKN
jgi:histidinol-phosphate/aromatic aminotransferase/cobyric acid decarboxylase-like protein